MPHSPTHACIRLSATPLAIFDLLPCVSDQYGVCACMYGYLTFPCTYYRFPAHAGACMQGIREEYHHFRDSSALLMLLGPLALVGGMVWSDRAREAMGQARPATGHYHFTPWVLTGRWPPVSPRRL